jgi:hypothetical protein
MLESIPPERSAILRRDKIGKDRVMSISLACFFCSLGIANGITLELPFFGSVWWLFLAMADLSFRRWLFAFAEQSLEEEGR